MAQCDGACTGIDRLNRSWCAEWSWPTGVAQSGSSSATCHAPVVPMNVKRTRTHATIFERSAGSIDRRVTRRPGPVRLPQPQQLVEGIHRQPDTRRQQERGAGNHDGVNERPDSGQMEPSLDGSEQR